VLDAIVTCRGDADTASDVLAWGNSCSTFAEAPSAGYGPKIAACCTRAEHDMQGWLPSRLPQAVASRIWVALIMVAPGADSNRQSIQ
jgi:hypothetical protein